MDAKLLGSFITRLCHDCVFDGYRLHGYELDSYHPNPNSNLNSLARWPLGLLGGTPLPLSTHLDTCTPKCLSVCLSTAISLLSLLEETLCSLLLLTLHSSFRYTVYSVAMAVVLDSVFFLVRLVHFFVLLLGILMAVLVVMSLLQVVHRNNDAVASQSGLPTNFSNI